MMNEIPEGSNTNGGADLEGLDYLTGVKSSTCLLLSTPSPTPNDFQHPLSDQMTEGAFMNIDDESNGLHNLDASAGDSSSSADSNSVVQDPVSAQLINNISMLEYQTLSKNGDLIKGQVEDGKINGNLNVNNRKLPNFVNWNWILIRKVLLWFILSGLVACLAAIVTMVFKIPTECNPDMPWHQGKVFYEIFTPSFKDSNGDGIGDLKGILQKLDYIESLGVSAIRLNYIFEASQYPEHYYNITSLLKIDRSIGTLKDFQSLVADIHGRNLSLVLDIPVISLASPISPNLNSTGTILLANDTLVSYFDPTSAAIAFWARAQNVDGFYLKNLENFVDEPNFGKSLQLWKQIIGFNKILMASETAYKKAEGDSLNILLSRIDLIDVHLDLHDGVIGLRNHIDKVISGQLWAKPYYPWVHWNIGNVNSERVSTNYKNNTLALTVLEFILPGTVSMFYGDEIALSDLPIHEKEQDFHEHDQVRNLVQMSFSVKEDRQKGEILSWNQRSVLPPQYNYLDIIRGLVSIRVNTPTIYLRFIYKENKIEKNAQLRKDKLPDDLIVIERRYPRRHSLVFIGNLNDKSISIDLTSLYYNGLVIAGTNTSLVGQLLYFDDVTFPPHSGIIVQLEK